MTVPDSIRHFIGGRAARSSYAKTFGAQDPATGKEYARVEVGVAADVSQAVLAAQAAFTDGPWAGTTAAERADVLQRIAAEIGARAAQLAYFEVLGAGLPVTQARQQVAQAARCFLSAADLAYLNPGLAGQVFTPGPGEHDVRRPGGVAGVVTSWRSPFLAQARGIAPALAAGCAVVLQVDVWAPLSAALLPEIAAAAGLPDGVLNIVHGTGNWRGEGGAARTAARDALVSHPGVPLLSFAGDAAAGRQAEADAAPGRKRLQTDLPGSAPCVILEDADAGRAAAAALSGAFALNGGRRTATARVLAARPVYETVVARLAEAAKHVRVGPPADPATEIGPLIHSEQHDRALSCVRRGIREGARLAAGGRRPADLPEGNYVAPAVLADVTPEMSVFAEDAAAPLLCVTPFDTGEEAVTLARAVPGAPPAYFWTADPERAARLSLAVDAPMTWVNAHNPDDVRTLDDEGAAIAFFARPSVIYLGPDAGAAPRLGAPGAG